MTETESQATNVTELSLIARDIVAREGIFKRIEASYGGSVYVSKMSYWQSHNRYYKDPKYQVFDASGKRVLVTGNFRYALSKLRELEQSQRFGYGKILEAEAR